ncbi:hypothetical protein CEXT_452401 [Caerostris extrusa]|uniref:Uncharacterized protein n=1 Tax=Caerostris extrusa TaxID=172846 RepID=A0AAV4TEK1_CAEEX|nr:hypothetical protein CEXT_452401 [Caerostris extrusa]
MELPLWKNSEVSLTVGDISSSLWFTSCSTKRRTKIKACMTKILPKASQTQNKPSHKNSEFGGLSRNTETTQPRGVRSTTPDSPGANIGEPFKCMLTFIFRT